MFCINQHTFIISAFRTNGKVKKKKKKNTDDTSATEEPATVIEPSTVDGVPQITSKRQKKRMKNVQAMAQRKGDDNAKTIAYLNKWQENRSEWKFEKLRQIAIQKNILNEKMIPDEQFEVAVAYLATTQVIINGQSAASFWLFIFAIQSLKLVVLCCFS